jgi:hypothetical protein
MPVASMWKENEMLDRLRRLSDAQQGLVVAATLGLILVVLLVLIKLIA